MWKRDDGAATSLPRGKRVRGYLVRRLPLGALITALETLQAVPKELCEALFPSLGWERAMLRLKRCDRATLTELLPRLIAVAPRSLVRLTAALIETDEGRLLEDPLLGADGLCELLLAWLDVNGAENFSKAAGRLIAKAKAFAALAGSND